MTHDPHDRVAHLNARDDLLSIAHDWPALAANLPATTGPTRLGQPRTRHVAPPLPINPHVAALRTEVTTYTRHLVAALPDYTPPTPRTIPTVLRNVATTRLGHFTANPETGPTFCHQAASLAHRVHTAAHPDGYRTLTTGLPCQIHDCPGTYTVRPTTTGAEPDLICNHNHTHRIPPAQWARDRWRARNEDAARHLLAAITGNHRTAQPLTYVRTP